MKRMIVAVATLLVAAWMSGAQEFNKIPSAWKWISNEEVAFTYKGTFTDDDAFSINARTRKTTTGIKAPAKFASFPLSPEGAANLTYSPDSTMLAFTRANDLWVADIATGHETRLTFDGTDLILNGYASWVYYEEILGRASNYKAFWWSPDSRTIGFYRFDNSRVPMFPIYSPKGQDGSLNLTRYPKSGENNPEVRIGMVSVVDAFAEGWKPSVVWADFDEKEDQYFGIPFWGADSQSFFIAREPRLQHELDLYAVSAADGSKQHIYHESYKTWLDWPEGMVFGENGLYMVRAFETGWEQIYYLSYDGKTLKRLTDGTNWRTSIVRVNEKTGDIFFVSNRDESAKAAFYKVDRNGVVTALTDPQYNVAQVSLSPDAKYFVASVSNFRTPNQVWLYDVAKPKGRRVAGYKVADQAGPDLDLSKYALAEIIHINAEDGQPMPAAITYPLNFDPSKKYPVHMEIYGGPNTAYVKERWTAPSERNQWWSEQGIITITADTRVAGHTGLAGTDLDFRNLTDTPVKDFVTWGKYLQSLPYVQADKIGVEGFSFGGSMTTLLLLEHSDVYHYGIAGGGVYDWMLYDTHYTERFMETPEANPDGYEASRVLSHVSAYPVTAKSLSELNGAVPPVMLRITHGTGDDNVHFQNTLQLIDELQKQGKGFELMIYPDGMHGYRGAQGEHSAAADRQFWTRYLLGR